MNVGGWWVVRTLGGAEFAVTGSILAAGFEAYCPTYTARHRNRYGHRDEVIESERPLFPGYLFVRPDHRFRREAFETSRIKLQVFRSSPVSDGVVDAVRATAAEASKVAVERKIEAGDFATLLRGVLKGESARVLRVRGQQALVDIVRDGRRAVLLVRLSDITSGVDGASDVAI